MFEGFFWKKIHSLIHRKIIVVWCAGIHYVSTYKKMFWRQAKKDFILKKTVHIAPHVSEKKARYNNISRAFDTLKT